MVKQRVSPSTPLALEDSILHTISGSLNVPYNRLNAFTHFSEDLYLDPVDLTLLIAELENSLNLYLSPEEVAGIKTIGDASRCFRSRL